MIKTILKALSYLNYYKKETIIILFFSFLIAVLTLLEPFFFRQIVDGLLADHIASKIFFFWILVVVFSILIRTFLVYFSGVIQFKTNLKTWNKAYTHLLSLSMSFFEKNQLGKVMRNLERGTDSIFMVHHHFFKQIFPNLFTIIILIPLLIILNWKIGLVLIIIVPLLSIIVFLSSTKGRKDQKIADEKWSELTGLAYDAASNISVVKSFTLIKQELQKALDVNNQALQKQMNPVKWWGITIGFSQFMALITNLIVFSFGGYLYFQGEITIGEIVMFTGFSAILVNIFQSSFWILIDLFRHKEKINIFFELLNEKADIVDYKKAKSIEKVQGNIEFKDVCFGYEKDKSILNNISFKAKKGQVVAFVGHTGSGKSTTAKLISRFYDINQGQILIDNIDIKNIKIDSLRKNIGIVFQDNLFFNDTFENNLKIGNPNATQNQLIRACQYAHVLDVIEKHKNGFQEVIGERGVKLSGGEKQRLGIARTLLKNAPILVLDEATSALDSETENKVQKALNNLMKGKTTIIIAHRLSTIKKADKIFVFDNGEIIEQGTFNSLYKKKGKFFNLVKQQMGNIVID